MKQGYRDYKVEACNSTVCGYPGRDFDWSKFCWDGSALFNRNTALRDGGIRGENAPLPWKDGGETEYLHVPYKWEENSTIYRVRPNESMYVGQTYRGRKIQRTEAVKKEDGWYWRLHWEQPWWVKRRPK